MKGRRFARAGLLAILATGFALRVALLAAAFREPGRTFTPDSHGYWDLARGLIDEGSFRRGDHPETFRTPGYPALLVPVELIERAAGGRLDGIAVVLGAQVLLDTALVWLTYRLGLALASRSAGLLAAAFQACSPLAIGASCRVLSDSLYAFLATVAVLAGVGLLDRRRGREQADCPATSRVGGGVAWGGLLGVVLAAACYVRPVGLGALAVFVVVFLAAGIAARSRPRLHAASAVLVVALVCLAPWVVRNGVRAGYWGFSDFATDSLYHYAAPKVLARAGGISEQQAWREMQADARRQQAGWPGPEAGRKLRVYRTRYALRVLAEHPWTYAKLHLAGDTAFWLPGSPDVLELLGITAGNRGTLAVLHQKGPWAAVRHYFGGDGAALAAGAVLAIPYGLKLLGLAVCAAWGVRRRLRLPAAVWLCLVLVLLAALTAGPASHPRFRVPVEPILSVAAGVAVVWVARRLWRRRGPKEARSAGESQAVLRGSAAATAPSGE